MSDMIAFCGLNCSKCPAFLATQEDNDTLRAEFSKMLATNYGLKYKPEEINCDGCHTTGDRILGYCSSCEIRLCGMEKKLGTCAECADQPCDKLNKFHGSSPDAKAAFAELLK